MAADAVFVLLLMILFFGGFAGVAVRSRRQESGADQAEAQPTWEAPHTPEAAPAREPPSTAALLPENRRRRRKSLRARE
jgi:hypothetical protein